MPMEVLNLATAALFDSLAKNNIDKSLMLEGTELSMDEILKSKKNHRWDQFVKMYENCSQLLGPEKVAREIAYTGIYNEKMSTLTNIATGLFDAKTIYWYVASFVSKHLYKDSVTFSYKKIKKDHVRIEILINPNLKDLPLLFETYTYLFENLPALLGLPKAEVTTVISERRAEYEIYLKHTSFYKQLFSQLKNYLRGNKSSITLMSEMEDKSLELSKLVEDKSQLLRVLSHDVTNQVLITSVYLKKLINKKDLSDEEKTKCLMVANNSTNRLLEILKNVQHLEISHLKGINLKPVDLDFIFNSLAEHFKEQLLTKKITLQINNYLPANITALADQSSLEINVLGNLISNAIKFSSENSIITLEANYYDGKVHLLVGDQGVGMSPDERSTLFTKKIRSSSIGTRGEMGTGFGLGIVNNYVNLYNGKISVHQNIPNGTIFIIELQSAMPQIFDGLYQENIKPNELNIRN